MDTCSQLIIFTPGIHMILTLDIFTLVSYAKLIWFLI